MIIVIFFAFLITALVILPIILSFIKTLKVITVIESAVVLGVASGSNISANRLYDKLFHVQSEYDWNIVMQDTWQGFPTAILSCVIFAIILCLIGYKVSRLFRYLFARDME